MNKDGLQKHQCSRYNGNVWQVKSRSTHGKHLRSYFYHCQKSVSNQQWLEERIDWSYASIWVSNVDLLKVLPNPFNTKTQSVSVTVTNNINNSCIISDEIEFIVTPLPDINENLIKIEQCDDGKGSENDGVTLHNLTESQSLFSSNFSKETFEYYSDENLTQKIDNPAAFYNDPLYDEVWIKITTENGCERISKTQNGNERLKIEITVGASEISETFIEDNNTLYAVCEDSNALSQDGLSVFSSTVLQEINDKLIASKSIFSSKVNKQPITWSRFSKRLWGIAIPWPIPVLPSLSRAIRFSKITSSSRLGNCLEIDPERVIPDKNKWKLLIPLELSILLCFFGIFLAMCCTLRILKFNSITIFTELETKLIK